MGWFPPTLRFRCLFFSPEGGAAAGAGGADPTQGRQNRNFAHRNIDLGSKEVAPPLRPLPGPDLEKSGNGNYRSKSRRGFWQRGATGPRTANRANNTVFQTSDDR